MLYMTILVMYSMLTIQVNTYSIYEDKIAIYGRLTNEITTTKLPPEFIMPTTLGKIINKLAIIGTAVPIDVKSKFESGF